MPRGTRHEITGLLLNDRGELVIEVDGGGTWRLDAGSGAKHFLGTRVTISGIRTGFDLLSVDTIQRS